MGPGCVGNLLKVFDLARDHEHEEGLTYYDKQRQRLQCRAEAAGLPLTSVIAAFVALSPNNAERSNYRALDNLVAEDYRTAAICRDLPAPKFQATLWLTWKRLNRVLYNPQMSFEWEEVGR